MSELQKEILSLSPSQRIELIAFIAESLKEDELIKSALERREKYKDGTAKVLSLKELKARLYE